MSSIASILLCWTLAWVAVVGWGLWVGRLSAFRGMEFSLARAEWLGLLACVFLLETAHSFVPIQGAVAAALLIGGISGLWINRSPLLIRFQKRPLSALQLVLVPLAAIWLAYLSSVPHSDTDTLLYHLQSVRWTQTYPVIVGLGNLHGRLAFNSAADLIFAALAVGPWRANPMAVGNGFFLLLLLINAARYAGPSVEKMERASLPMQWFWIAFLPALAAWAYVMPGTLLTDLAPFALLAAATSLAVELFLPATPTESAPATLALIGLLAIAAILMKLSSFAYSAGLLAVCLWQATPLQRPRLALTLSAGAILLLTPWIVRNVMLSGCLIYPVAATRLPLPWAVPVEMVKWEAYAIHTWALWDNWPPPGATSHGAWSTLWLKHFLRAIAYQYDAAFLPALIGAILWISARRTIFSRRALPLLFPIAAATAFWLLTAPTVRFLGPAIWLFAATGAAVYASAHPKAHTGKILAAMIAASLVIGMGTGWSLLHGDWRHGEPLRALAAHLFPHPDDTTATTLPTRQIQTLSGLAINVPIDPTATTSPPLNLQPYTHGNVGDAPLPASPYVHPKLRLRNPANLAAGFQIDP